MQNFILIIIISLTYTSNVFIRNEEGLDLFLNNYKTQQEISSKNNGIGNYLVNKLKEYSQEPTINYNEFDE